MTFFVTGFIIFALRKALFFAKIEKVISMFNNWINIHDLRRLKEKIARGEWRLIARRAAANARERTCAAWAHTENPPIHAWEIPTLRQRWKLMVSGDARIDHVEYISRRYLPGRKGLVAFSPGCGSGGNELRWAATGLFARIDAIDLSPARIALARETAAQKGLDGIVAFQVGDMKTIVGKGLYDLVIMEGALHHFSPMRLTLERVRGLLKPGGLLVVNDFVGPSRFQWTAAQLRAASAFLALIPEDYRRRWPDGKVKKRIDAPGRLRLQLADPSEAAESSRILPLLKEMFATLELKNKGGALACLVFFEIAQHYVQADETAGRILQLCFSAEDLLMDSGQIASDYILGIFAYDPGRP